MIRKKEKERHIDNVVLYIGIRIDQHRPQCMDIFTGARHYIFVQRVYSSACKTTDTKTMNIHVHEASQ